MKIALFGASGKIGQQITLEALVRGHEVKALVRHPETFPIVHPRLAVVPANILDPANVSERIADADVVVNATGARGNTDIRTFFIDSTNALIEGVKRVGGKRVMVVGGAASLEVAPGVLLIERDFDAFPPEIRPIALAQREQLDIYRASDIDWTFFSPSVMIVSGRRTGKYRLGTDQLLTNEQGESFISIEDYAVALLDEIEKPQFIRRRFTAVSLER